MNSVYKGRKEGWVYYNQVKNKTKNKLQQLSLAQMLHFSWPKGQELLIQLLEVSCAMDLVRNYTARANKGHSHQPFKMALYQKCHVGK